MTIARLSFVLLIALVVMLSVVALRAESTRLNYEIAKLERQAEAVTLEIREKELELARLGNPMKIRERVVNLNEVEGQPAAASRPVASRPAGRAPGSGKRRSTTP